MVGGIATNKTAVMGSGSAEAEALEAASKHFQNAGWNNVKGIKKDSARRHS